MPEADVANARDWTCFPRGLAGIPLIHVKDVLPFRIPFHVDATVLGRTLAQAPTRPAVTIESIRALCGLWTCDPMKMIWVLVPHLIAGGLHGQNPVAW